MNKRGTLRFGLLAVKGLGEDMVEEVVRERKKTGPYADMADFAARVPGRAFNKKSLEALIKSGALDRFGERNQLLFNADQLLEYHRRIEDEAASGQSNLFAGLGADTAPILRLKPAPQATNREKLAWEKELLGLYVSEHPFRETSDRLRDYFTPVSRLADLKREKKSALAAF